MTLSMRPPTSPRSFILKGLRKTEKTDSVDIRCDAVVNELVAGGFLEDSYPLRNAIVDVILSKDESVRTRYLAQSIASVLIHMQYLKKPEVTQETKQSDKLSPRSAALIGIRAAKNHDSLDIRTDLIAESLVKAEHIQDSYEVREVINEVLYRGQTRETTRPRDLAGAVVMILKARGHIKRGEQ